MHHLMINRQMISQHLCFNLDGVQHICTFKALIRHGGALFWIRGVKHDSVSAHLLLANFILIFTCYAHMCTFTWRRPLLNLGSETWLKLCLMDHLLLAVLIVAFSYVHMVIVFIHMWIRGWNMTQYLPCGSSSSWCHSDLHMFTCSMFIVYIHVPVLAWQWPLPSSGSEIWICLCLVDHLLLAYILMDYSGSRPAS